MALRVLRFLLQAALLLPPAALAAVSAVTWLELSKPQSLALSKGQTRAVACVSPVSDGGGPLSRVFLETAIEVEYAAKSAIPLFGVKGKSSDDAHENVARWVRRVLLKQPQATETAVVNELVESTRSGSSSNVVRDLVSSCPSPLFPSTSSTCSLTFSSTGTACVSVSVQGNEETRSCTVTATRRNLRPRYLVCLALCLLFIYVSHPVSKSKIAQYLIGAAIFTIIGLLLLVLNFDRLLAGKKAPRSLLFLLSSSAAYAAAVAFFFDAIAQLAVAYWEIFVLYLGLSSLCGAFVVRLARSREDTKHSYRVASKWTLRAVAVVLGYNAFPSPLVASSFLASLAVAWLAHSLFKFAGKSSK